MNGISDIYFEYGDMQAARRPWEYLPAALADRALSLADRLTAIRLRPGRPAQLVFYGGDELAGRMERKEFEKTVSAMLGHSLYARQSELSRGYFTLPDGSRVGVCGNFAADGPRSLADIGAVNIRISREIKGCADAVIRYMDNARGALVVSPPGMGKTTLLRDIVRTLSYKGKNVCVADERDELAACIGGIPTLDVGPRTDVISGMQKHAAIMLAIRSCAPDVIVADEIGDEKDAEAILDALRCGVQVIVSAHGFSLDAGMMRPAVAEIVRIGAFDTGILLGPQPGKIAETRKFDRGRLKNE